MSAYQRNFTTDAANFGSYQLDSAQTCLVGFKFMLATSMISPSISGPFVVSPLPQDFADEAGCADV